MYKNGWTKPVLNYVSINRRETGRLVVRRIKVTTEIREDDDSNVRCCSILWVGNSIYK